MFPSKAIVAAAAALMLAAATPAFAADTFTGSSMMLADVGRDVVGLSAGPSTAVGIVDAVPAELPDFERSAGIGGTVRVTIALDPAGSLTSARVSAGSGRPRLDASALRAVRATRFRAANVNGRTIGGWYDVIVSFDPAY